MSYSIWLNSNDGIRLAQMNNFITLEADKIENSDGVLTLTIPATFDRRLLVPDARIEIIRDGRLLFETIYLLQDWSEVYNGPKLTDAAGNVYANYYELYAVDTNHLLTRHAIPYAAESTYTKKTDNTDDMLKVIMRENYGTSAKLPTETTPTTLDTARDLTTYLTIEADASLGPSVTKSFANAKTVLEAFNEIADASAQAGTELFFDIVALDVRTLVFRTYTVYRGVDRTLGTVIFTPSRGTLFNARVSTKYSEEINYVYAKGQGAGTERTIVTSSDTARIAKSPFNRKETMVDGRNSAAGTTALQADADAELYAGKPTLTLEATIKSTENAVYSKDWNYGDYVGVAIGNYKFNAHVKRVSVKVANGREDIEADVKGVL